MFDVVGERRAKVGTYCRTFTDQVVGIRGLYEVARVSSFDLGKSKRRSRVIKNLSCLSEVNI